MQLTVWSHILVVERPLADSEAVSYYLPVVAVANASAVALGVAALRQACILLPSHRCVHVLRRHVTEFFLVSSLLVFFGFSLLKNALVSKMNVWIAAPSVLARQAHA